MKNKFEKGVPIFIAKNKNANISVCLIGGIQKFQREDRCYR